MVFWPAKLQVSDRVVMFRFEFWDCGESALKKFDHMLPVSRVGTCLGGSQRGWLSGVGLRVQASEPSLPGVREPEVGMNRLRVLPQPGEL